MNKPAPGKQPARKQIKIEIPADLPAEYYNAAFIVQTLSEVILNFTQIIPGTPKAKVGARIVMTPTNAKLLHKALGDSLSKYETSHGEIKVPPTLADQLFQAARIVGENEDDEGQGDA